MKRLYACFSLSVMIVAIGVAQNFRGGIKGVITDESGAVLASAVVKAANEGTGLAYATLSSSAGEFAFQDLPLGEYSITVSQSGFEAVKVSGVRVSGGAIYNLPIRLKLARVSSSVEVSAAAVSLETTSATQTDVVPAMTVQDLPVNGRNFTQLIALAPGFAGYGGSGSFNGSRSPGEPADRRHR
jgi:hypothetical protein